MRVPTSAALVMAVGLLVGCQSPDVGQPCTVAVTKTATVSVDWVEFGNPECEDTLTCAQSPLRDGSKIKSRLSGCNPTGDGTNCGYCTKPCVSNADCFQDSTGLECRSVVLDEAFIKSLDPAVAQKYLGDATASNYCAAPRPAP